MRLNLGFKVVIYLHNEISKNILFLKKLSHALTELRADLVQQAQENVRAASEGSNTTEAVKILVQKKTVLYKVVLKA